MEDQAAPDTTPTAAIANRPLLAINATRHQDDFAGYSLNQHLTPDLDKTGR